MTPASTLKKKFVRQLIFRTLRATSESIVLTGVFQFLVYSLIAGSRLGVSSWEEVNHSPRQIIMTDDSRWDPFTVELRSRLKEEEKY